MILIHIQRCQSLACFFFNVDPHTDTPSELTSRLRQPDYHLRTWTYVILLLSSSYSLVCHKNKLGIHTECCAGFIKKVFDCMTILSFTPARQPAGADSGHRFDAGRHWAASLTLGFDARIDGNTRITRLSKAQHYGPLRVQRPFYPEGRDGCCHLYLLHPPEG